MGYARWRRLRHVRWPRYTRADPLSGGQLYSDTCDGLYWRPVAEDDAAAQTWLEQTKEHWVNAELEAIRTQMSKEKASV